MIVVTPLGHAAPFGSPREIAAGNTPLMEECLLKEIMPWAEAIQNGCRLKDGEWLILVSSEFLPKPFLY
jgi:hypothetical protein